MTRFVSASLRPSPRSLTRDRTRQRDAFQLQFKSVWRPPYEHARLIACRRARIRTRDHYCTSRWWNHHSIDGGSTDDGSACPITHHPHAFHAHDPPCIDYYLSHPDRLDRSARLDPPRPTRHNSTRATMVMALTSQGFARAPTATRSALAPRGTWTLDAMTMAFVRSESVDGKRWTRGDDDDDARPTDARPRRDAGAIRDGDTRSGRPGG